MNDIETLRGRQQTIVARAKARGATVLNNDEDSEFRLLAEQIDHLERRGDLESSAGRIWRGANGGRSAYRPEGDTYNECTAKRGVSFIRDLIATATPAMDASGEARARMAAHEAETRDVSGLTTSVGTAGSFSPPQYQLDAWARYARPAAPLYGMLQKLELTGPTVKVPKLTAGTTTAVQATQNTSIATSTFTDEYLSTDAKTIAGATAVSQQLVDLSPIAIDQIVFTDLFAALAYEVEFSLWYDAQFGIDNLGVTTFALGSSNAEDFYSGISKAANFIHTNRYMAPDAIFCHPSVVNHLKSRFDTVGRPLVAPTESTAYNPVALAADGSPADGEVLHILGLPVIADATISTAGNVSAVYVMRLADSLLFTRGPEAFASPYPLATQLSWVLRVHSYIAPIHRYPESSIVKLTGFSTSGTYGGS